ncbi:MAG TPA: aminotransferase class V-fold PLP-dependent enzyme [Candidatus Acidoferrales bacterium]
MDHRKEFAEFDDVTYLDAATQGPLPLASAQAAKEALEWKKLPFRIPNSLYFDLPDRIRASIAKIIHAEPDDIALTAGASAGFAAVAAGLDWKKDDEVIVAQGEFPAHFATWLPYEKAGKLTVKVIAPAERFICADDYISAINARTRLVSASLIRFDNGARLDAKRVADACHAVGALFLLDASQCAGALPIDTGATGADFLVSSGYKWMLGPYGTGFFWARREWSERLPGGPVYWQSLEGADNFHGLPLGGLRVRAGARRWDSPETASFTNLAAFDASLNLVTSIGTDKIYEHAASLSRLAAERLPMDRCVLASPSNAERRGQFVCVAARTPEKTAELFKKLRDEKVIVCLREGVLRISPHIYNTEHDVLRLIAVLST